MKNSNDTIGNRTRDLPVCRAVPQPTAPPRTSETLMMHVQVVKTVSDKCIGLGTAFERKDVIVENKQFENFRRDTVT